MWLPEDITVKVVFSFALSLAPGGAAGTQWADAHRYQLHLDPLALLCLYPLLFARGASKKEILKEEAVSTK